MSKVENTYYQCDICGYKHSWLPRDWREYKLEKSWQSGSHGGWNEKCFLVCEECASPDSNVFRWIYKKFKRSLTHKNGTTESK